MMFNPEQKALALEFARALSARAYDRAYGMLSNDAQSRITPQDLGAQFEAMIPLDWGPVDPIALEENPAWDHMFVYVVLGGDTYSEAIMISSFESDGAVTKIGAFEMGRP